MFTDKQRLEKEFLKDMTRIGDLLDSSKMKYFVFGPYILSAHGIEFERGENVIVISGNKERIVKKMLKLNMTPTNIKENEIEYSKEFKFGNCKIKFIISNDQKIIYNNREIKLIDDSFENERIEVPSILKYGRMTGYFRIGKIEEFYIANLGNNELLNVINLSGKLNINRLIQLFKVNNLI